MREKALEELRLLHRVRHCDRLVRLLAIRVPVPDGAAKPAAAVMPLFGGGAGAGGGTGSAQKGSGGTPGRFGGKGMNTPLKGSPGGGSGGDGATPAGRSPAPPPSPQAFALRDLDHMETGHRAAPPPLGLPPSLVLEFMAGGTLQQRIKDKDEALLAWKAGGRRIALDVCEGLLFLHTRRPCIVHRDLRSVNVLLTADGRAKIADLGSAKYQERSVLSSLSVQFNQFAAFPPESMFFARTARSFRWDVWQFGALLFEVLCMENWDPADSDTPEAYEGKLRKLRRDQLAPRGVPAALAELVIECLQWEPKARPSTAALYPRLLAVE